MEDLYPTKRKSKWRSFFDILRWIPVMMVIGIIVWATYIYIIDVCRWTEGRTEQFNYLIVFGIIFSMIYWSFLRVICTRSCGVPDEFKLPPNIYRKLAEAESMMICHSILKEFSRNLPIKNINPNGSIRYCEKCRNIKPDRCHHCSSCRKCVLKMDHHCPWINNCVSFGNYKFFVLFLLYTIVGCVYVMSTTYADGYRLWKIGELHGVCFQIVSLFFMALLLGFSTITLLFYHFYLVLKNQTTIESMRKPLFKASLNIKSFNIGLKNNFFEVFGRNPFLWCLPIYTTEGDGVDFPVTLRECEEEPLV
ncbi:palmitoyltransferase ZDHHC20-A-like [Coccinella septempunctata]|uniref:palmitoyltransferase ZDHHC20-A-like n=1 Tax=Coccinella septempunctata TaxID=41139 RepID=UPI001D06CAE0|nr:palmitoyltransferase ZDHHC20-A-like [Coccinella septempunctata]